MEDAEVRRSSRIHDRNGDADVTEPEKKRQKIQNDKILYCGN